MVLDVRAIQQTVQDFQPKAALGASMFIGVTQREFYLPAVGTRERDRQLRTWDRSDYNAKYRGCRAGIAKKEAGLSWNITGKATVQVWSDHDGWDSVDAVTHFQDVLQNAHFGAGYQYFVKRLMRDYYSQDFGAVVEIIGPGEPDKPLAGAVTGIAVLDSLRCFATGNPVYPILYFSHLTNKMHRMHHTRVARFVDMPDGDERMCGAGECALSRYISTAYREMLMTRYIEGRLDDKPQPGMNVVSNISEGQVQTAFAAYDRQQMSDERPVWGKTVWFYSLDPSAPAKVEPISFAQTPEKFDYQVYTNQDVNELALAFNTDKNDIWELTGGNIGSGQQSEVQAQKARGKVIADFITLIERLVNMHLLPDGVDFAIKNRDEAEEKAQSELDKTLMDIAGSMKALGIPAININQMLVNRSETFRDVLTDDNSKIIATAQVDYVKPAVIDATVTNSETNAPAQLPAQTVSKDYSSTRSEFTNLFTDLSHGGLNDDVSRRRFGTVMRAQLRRLGQQAYQDGMKAGGVDDPLDEDDLVRVQDWLGQQSEYVTSFADSLFKGKISADEVSARAELWVNKSLDTVYQAGVRSANANGLYVWQLGPTEKHCPTCSRLAGQTHRMKEWYRRDLLPRSDKLACNGFRCACQLQRTAGKAQGRF